MGMGDVAMDRMTTSIAILIGALIIGGAIIGAQLMDHYQIAMSATFPEAHHLFCG
jgi:hypothetical protein